MAGLSDALWKKIEALKRECRFTCWHIEEGDELTFYDGSEPFGYVEYKAGSPIRVRWEALQKAAARELVTLRCVNNPTCPYCGHSIKHHDEKVGCTAVCQPKTLAGGAVVTNQCPCIRFPDKAGRWRL
jgi:hypothetical protein